MTWHHVALVLIAVALLGMCILAGTACSDSQVNSLHTIAAAIVGVAGGNAMGKANHGGVSVQYQPPGELKRPPLKKRRKRA